MDSLVNPLVSSVRNVSTVVKSTPFTSVLKETSQSTVEFRTVRGISGIDEVITYLHAHFLSFPY